MKNKEILAGVVTFNPVLDRFKSCIDSLVKQLDYICVFDNGSDNCADIEKLLCGYENVVYIKNGTNAGIATALARIMEYADQHSFDWVLSMDQDSLLQAGTVCVYSEIIENNKDDIGMLTCLVKDRNFVDEKYEFQNEKTREVDYCITSGALTNVSAYKKTKGYDESFFIDCVDFDICYSLRETGFRILRVNHVGLLHEVGHGENRRFLWKTIVVYHEKPNRIFYLARNTKRMYKKHHTYGFWRFIKKESALFARILFYEEDRWKKLEMFWKGIFA